MDIARLPKAGENNLWYRHNAEDAVLVFVHGILSDSRGCWLNQGEDAGRPGEPISYWPELIASDDRFKDVGIYLAGYHTAVDSGDFPIQQCASEVYSYLKTPDPSGLPPVMEKKKIIFVCHSMGGIVARYLLCEQRDAFTNTHVGIVLIASPSYGSQLARSLDTVIYHYNHTQGKQLRWGSETLRDLDLRFKNVKERRQIPNLSGIELFENRFMIHWKWLPWLSRTKVVTEESAARYFGFAKQVGGSDHGSICKPRTKASPVHTYLLEFLRDKDLLPTQFPATAAASAGAIHDRPPTGTPDPKAEPAASSSGSIEVAQAEALRNEWHPPEDLKRRGALTPCRLTCNLNYKSDGKVRWERYGDVLVSLKHPPTPDDVYLVPSRKSPRRFRDPKQLEEPANRVPKQRVTGEFVKAMGARPLEAFWFTKIMASTETARVHVYAPEYDDFLNAHAARKERTLVYVSYKSSDDEWRLRLRKVLDFDKRIESWDDSKKVHGLDFNEQMKEAVTRTKVMVVLASDEYLRSTLPMELELTPAIEAAAAGELRLLWIPVRTFAWKTSPFARFPVPVDPNSALTGMDDMQIQGALDALYRSICEGLGLEPLKPDWKVKYNNLKE
jgi:pimeloyl-ACP methyl ester carboxylesterase